jgi:hypothetical protein
MTDSGDLLSRLFRDPVVPERDEVFAARVAQEIAAARRAARVYRLAVLFAGMAGVAGLALAVISIDGPVGAALAGLPAGIGRLSTAVSPTMALVVAVGAIAYSQWTARRSA